MDNSIFESTPDIKISVKQTFNIDSDMTVEGFSIEVENFGATDPARNRRQIEINFTGKRDNDTQVSKSPGHRLSLLEKQLLFEGNRPRRKKNILRDFFCKSGI